MKTWTEIANTQEYKSLNPDDKEKARSNYFSGVVAPTLLKSNPKADLGAAKIKFDEMTLPSSSEYQKDRILRGFGNIFNIGFRYPTGTEDGLKYTPDVARMLGYKGLPAPSRGERVLGGVTEMTGSTLATAPLVVLGGAGLGPKVGTTVEALSTVLGGLGSEVGGDFASQFGRRQLGEGIGSLLGVGSGLGAAGITKGSAKLTQGFKDRKNIWDRMTNQRIGGILQSDKKYIENITEADTIAKKLQLNEMGPPPRGEQLTSAGFNLAQASDSPGIKSLFEVYERGNPQNVEQIVGQQKSLEAGIKKAEEAAFPDKGVGIRKTIDAELLNTQEQQGALAAQFGRKNPEEIGTQLKTIRDIKAKEVKDRIGADYDALYYKAEQEGIKVDMTDVGDSVVRIFGDDANVFQNPDMPSALSRVYNKYVKKQDVAEAPKAGNINDYMKQQELIAQIDQKKNIASFEELHSLWKLVNEQIPTFKMRGDDNAVRALMEVKGSLKSKIDALEASGSAIGNEFRELNVRYAREYADIYKKGAGGKLARFNRYGDTTPDEDVVRSLFFRPDKTTALKDFKKIYGDDPDAMALLTNGTLDIFGKAVIDKTTGLINPSAVNKFKKDYELLIDQIPGFKKIIDNSSMVNDALLERSKFYQSLIAISDKDKVSGVLNNDQVGRLMEFLVTNPDAMLRTSKVAISGGAGPQFARSLARQISEMENGYEYLLNNEKLLKPILDKIGMNHYENIKTIVKGWEISNRVVPKIGARAEEVVDPLRKRTGTSMDSLFSQYRAAQQGRTSFKQIGATISAKWLTKFGFDSMMEATKTALFDPNVAHTLARLTKQGPLATPNVELTNALRKHLFVAGIRAVGQVTEPGERKESINTTKKRQEDIKSEILGIMTP